MLVKLTTACTENSVHGVVKLNNDLYKYSNKHCREIIISRSEGNELSFIVAHFFALSAERAEFTES